MFKIKVIILIYTYILIDVPFLSWNDPYLRNLTKLSFVCRYVRAVKGPIISRIFRCSPDDGSREELPIADSAPTT